MVIGCLRKIGADCLILSNCLAVDDVEQSRWQNEISISNLHDGTDTGNLETIVYFHQILSISCNDESVTPVEWDAIEEEAPSEKASVKPSKVSPLPVDDAQLLAVVAPQSASDPLSQRVPDRLEIRIGLGLAAQFAKERGDGLGTGLAERVQSLRGETRDTLGFALPGVRLRNGMDLKSNEYEIRMGGVTCSRFEIKIGASLAIKPTDDCKVSLEELCPDQEPVKEPAFNLPATWLTDKDSIELAEKSGFTVVDPITVLITHFSQVVSENRERLLSYQDVVLWLQQLEDRAPALVHDFFVAPGSRQRLYRILTDLLKEKIWIGDFERIAESVATSLESNIGYKETLSATRMKILPAVVREVRRPDGTVPLISFDSVLRTEMENGDFWEDTARADAMLQELCESVWSQQLKNKGVAVITPESMRSTIYSRVMDRILDTPILSDREGLELRTIECIHVITNESVKKRIAANQSHSKVETPTGRQTVPSQANRKSEEGDSPDQTTIPIGASFNRESGSEDHSDSWTDSPQRPR